VEKREGFIVPPPGLIPEAPAEETPRKRGETTEKFPAFQPRPSAIVPPAGVVAPDAAAPSAPAEAVVPPEAAAPPAPEGTVTRTHTSERPGWALRLPDGGSLRIDGVTVVGRNPSPTAAVPDAAAVPLDDPEKSLSKTHAVIEPTATGLAVTDLHSTNGVAVVAPDGRTEVAEPGSALPAPAGSVIVLGRFRLTVEAAAAS
jgi:hypothetical protein